MVKTLEVLLLLIFLLNVYLVFIDWGLDEGLIELRAVCFPLSFSTECVLVWLIWLWFYEETNRTLTDITGPLFLQFVLLTITVSVLGFFVGYLCRCISLVKRIRA